jgi:PadR family transcriptional regulator, regulatory protein PadR
MRRREYLGEFELMVLLAVIRLEEDAYGVPISEELKIATGREASLGSVYAALDRLAEKGYVSSTLADPTPQRGGRAKRYFRATASGRRAVEASRAALTCLWRGVPRFSKEQA